MDRVPVAVQGGEAAGRRGLVGSLSLLEPTAHLQVCLVEGRLLTLGQQWGHPAWARKLWSPGVDLVLTIVVGQDDGPVPAILEEGGCRAEHMLSLDPARGSIHLQPVLRVIIFGVAVSQEGQEGTG